MSSPASNVTVLLSESTFVVPLTVKLFDPSAWSSTAPDAPVLVTSPVTFVFPSLRMAMFPPELETPVMLSVAATFWLPSISILPLVLLVRFKLLTSTLIFSPAPIPSMPPVAVAVKVVAITSWLAVVVMVSASLMAPPARMVTLPAPACRLIAVSPSVSRMNWFLSLVDVSTLSCATFVSIAFPAAVSVSPNVPFVTVTKSSSARMSSTAPLTPFASLLTTLPAERTSVTSPAPASR